MSDPAASAPEPARFPPGLHHAFWFATFNALSFPIVIGAPMILYAKTLGASATVLGIIAGMMPLLVIFQIPAASHVSRVGYKRFVYAGWGMRVLFIGGMAVVPLLGGVLDPTARLALLLLLLFAFNLSRGISSCAWLPWIAALVPETVRGRYLARDAACVNFASFLVIVLAALALGAQPAAWQFTALFLLSAAMGGLSLVFLKRIPDVEVPEAARRNSHEPVPWLAISQHPPFRKLLRVNVVWPLAVGGLGAFTIAWLKAQAGLSEGQVLLVSSAAYLGGLSSLWLLGPRLDRLGSRPVMMFCMAAWMVIVAGWVALAGRALQPTLPILLALQFLMGLAAALVNMSNVRLAMAIIPVMGRDHFFALYSVVGSLAMGLSPILWGVLIDSLRGLDLVWHGFAVNRYSVFFALTGLGFLVSLGLCARLEEPKAASMEALLRDLLIESPQRVWVRLWPKA
ncbi:MAG: major facilitator superfamily protein [Limisphaerales bacterium]|nr:MAG: major facilitator superfamily protein [Limisphaerales bacterium]KAG0510173.1 MAG: major facilitator superfamily protein [Limisphaerales bacterium]TXT51944.1 MAG: major facilitator superfamily protein [Limisphaerales bacterium]